MIEKIYDVVVVGGGMSGICAAIAAARGGVKTALIQDRPVLGGNASSEVRMHICGATHHGHRKNARETGIIEEILLDNRIQNEQHSFSVFETVMWEKVYKQEGLDLYLNARMHTVEAVDDEVAAICVEQMTNERNYRFSGRIFIDCTGDGVLAQKAGAITRQGREAKEEFKEQYAPETADTQTMGNSLMFRAIDMGHPVSFEKPDWAYTYEEENLQSRDHLTKETRRSNSGAEAGYWWIELGGTQNTIEDAEEIRDELLKTLYGVWDHIKNKGDHGAENFALDWVQFLPGKRESRRIEGDYLLKEQDLLEGKVFDDAVAYGGWPMDMHPPQGFYFSGDPTVFLNLDKMYTIPYRCYYSRNIKNLMMAGRNISTTHMAFGSTRVMATCAIGGQAAGSAAAMAVKKKCSPREIGSAYIKELQKKLQRDDCYIPGFTNEDEADLARWGSASASSALKGCGPDKVIDGHQRNEYGACHEWISEKQAGVQWLEVKLAKAVALSEVHLKFDTDLTTEINISMIEGAKAAQRTGMPYSLVKKYTLELLIDGKIVHEETIGKNHQRFCIHTFDHIEKVDTIRVTVFETWGSEEAKIFEVRAYA